MRRKKEGIQVDEQTLAERRVVYEAALNCKDPVKIAKMAKVFREQGCIVEATMLEKRYALCTAPKDVLLARREAFRKGMRCKEPHKVRKLAAAFDEMGATGAAADLNRYASGLEDELRMEAEGITDAV